MPSNSIANLHHEGSGPRKQSCTSSDLGAPDQASTVPSTPGAASAALPWFESQTHVALLTYQRARVEFERVKGELDICRMVARGDFEPLPPEGAAP